MKMAVTKKREYTQAQNKATQRYIKANYDEIKLRLEKGKKEEIKAFIDGNKDLLPKEEQSINGFIKSSINQKMQLDNQLTKE